jgi:hypothetical protein
VHPQQAQEDNVEDLDPESKQVKEVFARYGLAMYQAQCVERELAITLCTVYGPGPKRMTRDQLDRLYKTTFRKTLGRLVADLRSTGAVDVDLEKRLTEALEKRNWLAHDYFWERAVSILKPDSHRAMIAELQDAAEQFDDLDAQLTSLSRRWAEQHGVTEKVFQESWENLVRSGDELN